MRQLSRFHSEDTCVLEFFLLYPLVGPTSLVLILKLKFPLNHWATNGKHLWIHRENFAPDSLKLILRPISVNSLGKFEILIWLQTCSEPKVGTERCFLFQKIQKNSHLLIDLPAPQRERNN